MVENKMALPAYIEVNRFIPPPPEPVVKQGVIVSTQSYVNGKAASQAYAGDSITFKVEFRVYGDPTTEDYKVVHEIARPDVGKSWGGKWSTARGNGTTYSVTIGPFTMPSNSVRWYVTMWDANWKLLAESSTKTLELATKPVEEPVEPIAPALEFAGAIYLQRELYAEVPPKQRVTVQCKVHVTGPAGHTGRYSAILWNTDISPDYTGAAGINGIEWTETIPQSGEYEKVITIPFTMPESGALNLVVGFWGPKDETGQHTFYTKTQGFTLVVVTGAPPPEEMPPEEVPAECMFKDFYTEYGICIKKKWMVYGGIGLAGIIGLKLLMASLAGGRR